MRVFKTKWFRRFARKARLSDAMLIEAIVRANSGLIDADLGHGLIKQRIARKGGGRSGGYRTLIVYRSNDRAIFIFGFAKNELGNIGADELQDLNRTAGLFMGYTEDQMNEAVANEVLWEIEDNGQTL
jgi:hypothetical protein